MEKIHNIYRRIRDKFFTLLYRFSFKELAPRSTLSMPFFVEGAKNIAIKKEVFIKPNAWFLALNHFDSISKDTKISIDEGTYIGRNAHIVSLKSIQIGKNVLMGDNVYIADNFHRFNRVDIPYKSQGVGFKAEVEIGDGTWLGENVCVISSKLIKPSHFLRYLKYCLLEEGYILVINLILLFENILLNDFGISFNFPLPV